MKIIYEKLSPLSVQRSDDLAFKLPDGRCLSIFISSMGGYDYTIYNHDYTEADGGIYDDETINIYEAIEKILEDEFLNEQITLVEIDFYDLIEQTSWFYLLKL